MTGSQESWENRLKMSAWGVLDELNGSVFLRRSGCVAAFLILFALGAGSGLNPQENPDTEQASEPKAQGSSEASPSVEIVQHGGYPELRVNGSPFFIHSAAFFYYRVPRDMWALVLERYRAAGINTIDIYIPWNWHEPQEGALDFDGHSNPRRDLRGLLRLIGQKKFQLIARPGPEILNEWRNGGYPDWLLERPEYKMDARDRLEGRYSPLDSLNTSDAEAAARGWLANETHMKFARAWLAAVAKELAAFPYHDAPAASAPATLAQQDSSNTSDKPASTLLFVQLGDDFAIGRTNRAEVDFWRYVQSLRKAIEAGGVRAPVFINPTDMRVSAAGSREVPPIGVMGQWYLQPPPHPAAVSATSPDQPPLTGRDLSEIEFFTEELKTQPEFPAVMIEYQAGWYAPGDDDRPLENPPENTLLSSRLLIANGIQGFNYLPLQDTYTPAGYSVPWANRAYRWDAAFGADGERQPRLRAIQRNGRLLDYWGPMLAASHKRADFGIVYAIGAYPQDLLQPDDIRHVSRSVMQIERLARLALLSSELLDPEYQPVEQLLRDAVLFLPTPESESPQFVLSDRAQRALVEYVRQGGTLAIFPMRPRGEIIQELFASAPAPGDASVDASAIRARWKFGEGEVIESSKDFFSWVSLDESLSRNQARPDAPWALQALREIMTAPGVHASVRFAGKLAGSSDLVVSEIVTNEGSAPLGRRTGGKALLSVTNLSATEPSDAALDVLPPETSARGTLANYLPVHVVVPPRESLLLPIEIPLCAPKQDASPCGERVISSGAEFLGAQREGKTLELIFYVPARAEVLLHLEKQPSHILLEETQSEAVWTESEKELRAVIPRGAAPGFLRTLKVELPYRPSVPEPEKAGKPMPQDFDFRVENAIRLPVGGNSFLHTYPPVVLLEPGRQTMVLIQAENRDPLNRRDGSVSIEGDLRGSGVLHVPAPGISVDKIRVRPSEKQNTSATDPVSDTFLHGTIRVQLGKDDRSIPVVFLKLRETGTTPYRYDFDRDGADEWVLEDAGLRLIVSPESGGQAVGFVDKSSGANLSTSVGLLRDAFSYTPGTFGASELRPSGRWGLFNQPYRAEWAGEALHPALKLSYDAADVFPAGAHIEKTLKLEIETLTADYEVSLNPAGTSILNDRPQAFVALNSFPAVAGEHGTRFCWQTVSQVADAAGTSKTVEVPDPELPCENFIRSAKPIGVPAGMNRVEIHTPGRPSTAVEWDCGEKCGQMTIEPKNFSALFRLEFAPLSSGVAAHYTVRISAVVSP